MAQPKVEMVKGRQSGPGNLKGVMYNHSEMLSSNRKIRERVLRAAIEAPLHTHLLRLCWVLASIHIIWADNGLLSQLEHLDFEPNGPPCCLIDMGGIPMHSRCSACCSGLKN